MTMSMDKALTGQQLAMWLEREHPDIFEVLYAQAKQSRTLSGFGDDTSSADMAPSSTPDVPLTDITFDPNSVDTSASTDIPLQSVNVATQSSSDSGWASGVLSDLSSVGNWLVSPQGLSSIASVGTAVLKVQEAQQNAAAKMAVINANAARAAAGSPVIPITYTQNAQGQLIPVYDAATAQMMPPELETAISQGRAHAVALPDGTTGYAVDPGTLAALLGSTGLPWYVWAMVAALIVVLIAR